MWKLTLFELVLTLPIILVSNSSIHLQSCSKFNVSAIDNFNISKYMGTWYEVKRFPNFFQSGICDTAEYFLINSTFFNVTNREIIVESENGYENNTVSVAEGYGGYENPEQNDGKLIVTIKNRQGSYWIIGTDYGNYSVVYSCTDISTHMSYQLSWVLTRMPELSPDVAAVVDNIIEQNNLDPKLYVKTEQNPKICGRE